MSGQESASPEVVEADPAEVDLLDRIVNAQHYTDRRNGRRSMRLMGRPSIGRVAAALHALGLQADDAAVAERAGYNPEHFAPKRMVRVVREAIREYENHAASKEVTPDGR